MNSVLNTTSQVGTKWRGERIWHPVLLFLSVIMIAVAGMKFHSAIHFVFGGVFMLVSVAALTVSAIDCIAGSRSYHNRLVITVSILSITIGFLLIGQR
jgi:hypothetical protein